MQAGRLVAIRRHSHHSVDDLKHFEVNSPQDVIISDLSSSLTGIFVGHPLLGPEQLLVGRQVERRDGRRPGCTGVHCLLADVKQGMFFMEGNKY